MASPSIVYYITVVFMAVTLTGTDILVVSYTRRRLIQCYLLIPVVTVAPGKYLGEID
jgi:hypothetical protein